MKSLVAALDGASVLASILLLERREKLLLFLPLILPDPGPGDLVDDLVFLELLLPRQVVKSKSASLRPVGDVLAEAATEHDSQPADDSEDASPLRSRDKELWRPRVVLL